MEYSEKELQELYDVFQTETDELIHSLFRQLSELERNTSDSELLMNIFRDVHGLKGAVRMIGYENIQNLLHLVEDIISGVRDNLIRINVDIVMEISSTIELVSEYIRKSIERQKEYIDTSYNECTIKLQKISDIQLLKFAEQELPIISQLEAEVLNNNSDFDSLIDLPPTIQDHINSLFAQAFETLDAIVPEVVTDEIKDLFE